VRENQGGLARQRKDYIYVSVHDLEAGNVKDRAFESGVLIAAYNERVQALPLHAGANVFVTAVNFLMTGQCSLKAETG
jgi:hypothetical protein